ncbi:hypothetical protein [Chroococcidiopsis sp.]|uniref:hypothetical protein n=1 Tax=Chroococcidiopsis sp. TaxID=3088168 RepID=UPI003F3C5AE9
MKTLFAHGRASLPAPVVTSTGAGGIQGAGQTYYFWLKARNRVGFNQFSPVQSITIANNKTLQLSPTSLNTFPWEDWRSIYLLVSTSNDPTTARIIYRFNVYEPDHHTLALISGNSFSDNYVLNGFGGTDPTTIATSAGLPAAPPNGFRVTLQSTNRVYEWVANDESIVDNITVLSGIGGRWKIVLSGTVGCGPESATIELFEVAQSTFENAPLDPSSGIPIPLKYYVQNSTSNAVEIGELSLNAYLSDPALRYTYDVQVMGYLNLTTYALDTFNVQYAGSTVEYPATKIQLSKALPPGSALVLEITPVPSSNNVLLEGTYLTLYPKLNDYTIVEDVKYFGDPVADLSSLKSLPLSIYRPNQVRFVVSTQQFYVFSETSGLSDNGKTVIAPNVAAATGRWLSLKIEIPDSSITVPKLAPDVLALLETSIQTTTKTLDISTSLTIDLDAETYDYVIVNGPLEDGDPTLIDVVATLSNNETRAVLVELRSKTGLIQFSPSLLFPGGQIPTFGGNGKNDLFAILLTKDSNAVLKKRIYLLQKNIG